MKSSRTARTALLATATCLALALAACSSGRSTDSSGAAAAASRAPSSAAAGSGQPSGSGCSALPTDGPGSFAGMSGVPVATAIAASPLLTQLAKALAAANLVDSFNSAQDITVLAPVDAAFQAVPADQLAAVTGDVPSLTSVLTHHVLQGRLTPKQLPGQRITLDNDTVVLTGSGPDVTIPGDETFSGKPAGVGCGGIRTANATVYLIDQVLKPRATG